MDFWQKSYNFNFFDKINWISSNEFYFLGSTNLKNTNIFYGKINDNVCKFSNFIMPFSLINFNQKNIFNLTLSYDNNLFAFIAKDEFEQLHIFIYDLNRNEIIKLVKIQNNTDLIWSEKNDKLYYYENNTIYSINLNGVKDLVLSETKNIYKLLSYPKQKYKFIYITSQNNNYYIYLKNMDNIGQGDLLFNIQDLKDILLYHNSDFLYYENFKGEIFSYNLNTTDNKLILSEASLLRL